MYSVDAILDRIKIHKGFKTDTSLADFFKVKPTTVSNWRKRNSLPIDLIFTFCEDEKIPIGGLLAGQITTKIVDIDGQKVTTMTTEEGVYQQSQEFAALQEKHRKLPPLEASDTDTKTLEEASDQSAPVIQGTYQSEFRVSEALTMCARVLESGTSYATALYLNIQHFDRAVSAEARIATVEKSQADIEARSRDFEQKMQAQMNEMRSIITTLQNENRELRKEVNRLKATYESPDGSDACLTNTFGNE